IAAAKTYMGGFAWPTVMLTLFVVVSVVANFWLFAIGVMPLWAAILIYGALTYMSYTPLHEAAHGNIHGDHRGLKWLNDLCGYLVAPLIMVPYASHTVEHFTHHRHTNQPEKDPDNVVKEMGDSLWGFIRTGFQFLWVQNSFYYKHAWSDATLKEKLIYGAELSFSIGWRVAFVLLVAREGALALIVLGYFIGAFFTAYWFAYRPHHPYENAKRYQNTNSLIMPTWMKPLEWFWLGQNLHSIHHLFPRVPFYKYHALHRDIEPIMRAHGTPIIGIFNRQEIPSQPASAS
ncbi:MAG: fatty acid desaturase, partial [Salinisphaeraceae bacterium]|nr:fatty acid desaturase [Salinisphaeraceae bacterium]